MQILTQRHRPLLYLLGKTSGGSADKFAALAAAGAALTTWRGHRVLSNAHGFVHLRWTATAAADGSGWSQPFDAGDHKVFICEAVAWHVCASAGELLDGALLSTDASLRPEALLLQGRALGMEPPGAVA